jgi:hypothetical protein
MIDHKNREVRLKIVVSDSGVGIDLSVSGTFEPYSQAKLSDYHTRGLVWDFPSYPVSKSWREHPSRVRGWERNHLHSHCVPLQVPLDKVRLFRDSQLDMNTFLLPTVACLLSLSI